jgi:hypothetical protein
MTQAWTRIDRLDEEFLKFLLGSASGTLRLIAS